MKKVVLGLMLVMGLSLVGCGSTESKNDVVNGGGVAIEKPVETETEVETEEEVVVSLEMSVEEMKEYYNDNQFVGTPRVEVLTYECGCIYYYSNDNVYINQWDPGANIDWDTFPLKSGDKIYGIVVDNGTPDDVYDDELAYYFTTPIE